MKTKIAILCAVTICIVASLGATKKSSIKDNETAITSSVMVRPVGGLISEEH